MLDVIDNDYYRKDAESCIALCKSSLKPEYIIEAIVAKLTIAHLRGRYEVQQGLRELLEAPSADDLALLQGTVDVLKNRMED